MHTFRYRCKASHGKNVVPEFSLPLPAPPGECPWGNCKEGGKARHLKGIDYGTCPVWILTGFTDSMACGEECEHAAWVPWWAARLQLPALLRYCCNFIFSQKKEQAVIWENEVKARIKFKSAMTRYLRVKGHHSNPIESPGQAVCAAFHHPIKRQ